MQTDEYLKSNAVKNSIDDIIKGRDDYTDDQVCNLIKNIVLEAFNSGIVSNMNEKQKISKESLQKKTKEITGFLPAHFKSSETGKQLLKTVQDSILANTTDYVLNVGFETVIEDAVNKVLQIAYSVGVTTGFEIASDSEMKSIYTANVERFMKSGTPGNN